jgi:hypothetical protein
MLSALDHEAMVARCAATHRPRRASGVAAALMPNYPVAFQTRSQPEATSV